MLAFLNRRRNKLTGSFPAFHGSCSPTHLLCFGNRLEGTLSGNVMALVAPNFRQEKRAQRLTFWVRRPPGGVGVFHAKGWWPKSSRPPSKVCLPWVSKREEAGMSREFCWDVPDDPWGVFKKLCKKSLCAFFVPYNCTLPRDYDVNLSNTPLMCRAMGFCQERSAPLQRYRRQQLFNKLKTTPHPQ